MTTKDPKTLTQQKVVARDRAEQTTSYSFKEDASGTVKRWEVIEEMVKDWIFLFYNVVQMW